MRTLKRNIIFAVVIFLTSGCAAVPFGIGLIPGAPTYVSSVIGNGQSAYVAAVDERDTKQQMLDAIVAGHAQAVLYKHKDIQPTQITAYCYFGKLYLVGEYDSQEQLRNVYECMDKVEGKRAVISRLYLREEASDSDFFSEQALATELKTQLMVDFEVTSSPIDVEIVQGDIILLGVISDKNERDRIMAHALSTVDEGGRVISYLYHQENGGPEPRIMTAQLMPSATTLQEVPKSKAKSPKKPKRKAKPKKSTKKEKKVARSAPPPPLVVNGRVTGL